MESFPPPAAADIVHQPDDAPFLQPDKNGRPRRWLWLGLALAALAAVVLGVVLFADQVGDGTHPEASSQSSVADASDATETTSASPDPVDTTLTAVAGEPTTAPPDPETTAAEPETTAQTEPETTATATTTATTVPATTVPATTVTEPTATTVAAATTVPVVPIPGWDLSDVTVRAVIVSPGKSNGRPAPGAVPLGFGVLPTFPASTEYVCIFWNTNGMPSGVPNGIVWTRDGQVVRSLEQTSFEWDKGSRERPNWCVPSQPIGIDPGFHRVEYYVAGVQQWVAEFVIGG